MNRIKSFIFAHPVLLVAYPVDLILGIAFMLSITTGSHWLVSLAFCGFIFLLVTVKLSLAAERSAIGNLLCTVAVILNAFAMVSFFVTHTAPHAVVRETVQIRGLRDELTKWDSLVELTRSDIRDKLRPEVNQRTVVDRILTPQLEKDQQSRSEAQVNLDAAIQAELEHIPDAIEVFERPFRLLADPSLGRVALLLFAIGASLFLEGVMWRSMRGKAKSRPPKTDGAIEPVEPVVPVELTTSLVYPRGDNGDLLPPMQASKALSVPFDVALALYSEERERMGK